jgi:hypothetical protein
MWRLGLIVLLAGLLGGCSPSDPDAEGRDRYREAAKVAAEHIELPDGFTAGMTRETVAQTPKENRGGGQSGHVTVVIETPAGMGREQVLATLDTFYVAAGFERVVFNKNYCNENSIEFSWPTTAC